MPALPPAANTIRLGMKHTVGTDLDVFSRFYISYTGTAPTPATAATFLTAMNTAYGANLKSLLNQNYTLTQMTFEDLTSSTGAVATNNTAIVGTRTGSANDQRNCVLLNFSVARRYRGGKPRIYLPFGSVTDELSGNSWASAFVTAVNTGWTNFIAALVAAPWAGATITGQSNVIFYNGFTNETGPTGRVAARSTPRVGSAVVDAIIAHACSSIYGTQRRRLRP